MRGRSLVRSTSACVPQRSGLDGCFDVRVLFAVLSALTAFLGNVLVGSQWKAPSHQPNRHHLVAGSADLGERMVPKAGERDDVVLQDHDPLRGVLRVDNVEER